MKKILILCLLLFGCDEDNDTGICLTTSQYTGGSSDQTCKENITQEECLEDVPSDGEDYIVNNIWIITTQTCEEWNEHGLDID